MAKTDVILIHPPSVYDFRKHQAVWGLVADVVPSTSIFDMYPVGLTSIAGYLEERGLKVRIINIAYRMLISKRYDVEKTIAGSRAKFYGISFHWLPHVQGSLEIAGMIKKIHPESPVIMGGLSSSYFYEELINCKEVDYVLRGDSVEEPFYRLIDTLTRGKEPCNVPNLAYKKNEGQVKINIMDYIPEDIDYIDLPNYRYVLSSVLKNLNLLDLIPFRGWLDYPITMLLTSRGCSYNCAICGGSRSAYKKICNREKPAFRSPEKLVDDIKLVSMFSKAPIIIIHDLRHGGDDYARKFWERISEEDVKNEIIIELFKVADDEYFKIINQAVRSYSIQISVESQKKSIREMGGKFSNASNTEIIETFKSAFRNGCKKIDLFFIIGLPDQSYEDAVACVDFCREALITLRKNFGDRAELIPYVSPYAPFLDPGCAIYEDPDVFGYAKLWDRLEDYRQAMLAPSWKYMLNYETKKMTREQLVAATYDSIEQINEFKWEMGLIDEGGYKNAKNKIVQSRKIMKMVDEALIEEMGQIPKKPIPPAISKKVLNKLRNDIDLTKTEYVLCGEKEMRWKIKGRFKGLISLASLYYRLFSESRPHDRRVRNLKSFNK